MFQRIAPLGVCLFFAGSCTKERPAWPKGSPEVDTIQVRANVVTVPAALTNVATVKKDTLSFPASMAAEVMANWPAGKVIVGSPASEMASRRTNPFGFLRKVTGTRIENDQVVVDTAPASIDEAIVGDFVKDLDLDAMPEVQLPEGTDLSAYDVPVVLGGTGRALDFPTGLDANPDAGDATSQPLVSTPTRMSMYGTPSGPVAHQRQPLDISTGAFQLPSTPLTILNVHEPVRIPEAPGASLDVSAVVKVTPVANFQPRLHFDYSANVVPPRLNWVEFNVSGDLTVGSQFEVSVSALRSASTTVQQEVLLLNALRINKLLKKEVEVPLGRPVIKEFAIGPVPMVSTTRGFLLCEASFEGAVQLKGSLRQSLSATAGLRYSRSDGWSRVLNVPLTAPVVSGDLISGQAGIELDCGVILRTEVRVAGIAGPYAQVRADAVGTAKISEACPMPDRTPKNHPADVKVELGVKAYAALQVGVDSIDFLKLITLEYGPYELWRKNWNEGAVMTTPNPNYVPSCTLSFCPPRTITEPEFVDIQTWTAVRAGAGRGRPDAGVWCTVECDDGQKNGAETDVDCGGPNCRKCAGLASCAAPTDCLSGVCGAGGTCAASLCEDGLQGQQETDVDCGGPTCQPCPVIRRDGSPSRCDADRDCVAPFFCSNDGVSPKVCTDNLCRDGNRSGAEPDVDCGAVPGCSALCTDGLRCNSEADCVSHACNVNTRTCVATTCFDGLLNGDEADVDCGGSCAAKCATGKLCNFAARQNADCVTGICSTPYPGVSRGTCVASACNDNRQSADETDVDCGGNTCSARCPNGAGCGYATDCAAAGAVCNQRTNRCAPPGCDDGILNGGESSIDCGGPTCVKCGLSKACSSGNDCVSGSCFSGRCVSGPCENGVKDATEADVDCGGSCSGKACATGNTCTTASDCLSNLCVSNRCSSDACLDRVRNGAETGVDCGGNVCVARCTSGLACNANSDCVSNLCNPTLRTCAADTCSDGVLTATNESDVDCGGSCGAANPAKRCAVNKVCAAAGDCASGVCNLVTLRCVPNTCFDSVQNGSETDLDCGGACEPKCAATKVCAVNTDCQSGSCNPMGQCATDQCSDGRLNGSESAIDCGGTCATKCAVGQACATGADCVHPQMLVGQPGFCSVATNTCAASSCNDGVQDNGESGLDCGGPCAATCAVGQGCGTGADCTSTFCNPTTRLCVASQCQDGVRNGNETDIDCGGGTCGGCAVGQGCTEDFYCASGYCGAASLCIPTIPKSCLAVFNRNGPGDRTDATFLVDPDGPRTPSSTVDKGLNSPFLTFCKNTPETVTLSGISAGGWTPVMYMNSRLSWSSGAGPTFEQTSIITSGVPNETCSFGNSACSGAPGTTCRSTAGGLCQSNSPLCFCTAPGRTWPAANAPGLPAHPINYSATTYGGGINSFQMHLNHNNSSRTTTSTVAPSAFRLIAYRAGVVVFDSKAFFAQPPLDNFGWQLGKFATRNTNSNFSPNPPWNWCRTGDYSTGMTANEPMVFYCDPAITGPNSSICWNAYQDRTPRSNISACNGFYANFHYNTSYGPLDSTSNQSVLATNGGTGFYYAGATVFTASNVIQTSLSGDMSSTYTGVWWGTFGYMVNYVTATPPSGTVPPYISTGGWMGICNNSGQATGQDLPCSPTIHRGGFGAETNRQMALNANELNVSGNNSFGTLVDGSSGLVFVLWAQF